MKTETILSPVIRSLSLKTSKNALSLAMKMRCIDKGCTTIEEAVYSVEHYEALFTAEKEQQEILALVRGVWLVRKQFRN